MGGHVPAPATPKVKLEVLYLLSGEPRENDLTMELVRIGHSRGRMIEVTDIDMCQGPDWIGNGFHFNRPLWRPEFP